jgi:RimJ/RimL family protein N-acetyltransferase
MAELMTASDIAVSAAGQTLFELARCGVPTIAVGVAENQRHNLEGFTDAGVCYNAGWWGEGNATQSDGWRESESYRQSASRWGDKQPEQSPVDAGENQPTGSGQSSQPASLWAGETTTQSDRLCDSGTYGQSSSRLRNGQPGQSDDDTEADPCIRRIRQGVRYFSSAENRRKHAEAGRRLVDGKGAARVAKAAFTLLLEKTVRIREASEEDIDRVFGLSNDPGVRAVSFNPDPIAYSDHRHWFDNMLKSPDDLFYLGYAAEELAGQIRYKCRNGEAEISISVAECWRSIGTGSFLLKKTLPLLKKARPAVHTITALIKKENRQSISFFTNNGFRMQNEIRMLAEANQAPDAVRMTYRLDEHSDL